MDANLFRDVNHFAIGTGWAHGFMSAFAVYGVGIFGLLVLAGWWYARYQPDAARAVAASIWAAAATLIAVALNQPIVKSVGRTRPYYSLHGVEVLISRTHDFSFPSDHAVTAGAATAGLWILSWYAGRNARVLASVATALALFIAFARVYVGAHYPGDVIAGLAFGAAVAVAGWLLFRGVLTAVTAGIERRPGLRFFVKA